MTLQEALKENDRVQYTDQDHMQYFMKDGLLHYHNVCSDSIHLSGISYNETLRDVWTPLPKEPCKHEPIESRTGYSKEPYALMLRPVCKHCGIKIKAMGWEEV